MSERIDGGDGFVGVEAFHQVLWRWTAEAVLEVLEAAREHALERVEDSKLLRPDGAIFVREALDNVEVRVEPCPGAVGCHAASITISMPERQVASPKGTVTARGQSYGPIDLVRPGFSRSAAVEAVGNTMLLAAEVAAGKDHQAFEAGPVE